MIPNTLHYIFASNKFKFTSISYASVMSALKFGKFDKIVIHEDGHGDTAYYRALRKNPNVTFEKVSFNKEFQLSVEETRFEILYKEGGVSADFNTIFLKPPPLLTAGFVCRQWIAATHFNHYVIGARPNSQYIESILNEIKPLQSIDYKTFWKNTHMLNDDLCAKHNIAVLPSNACFPYTKTQKQILLGKEIDTSCSFSVHLWNFKKNMTIKDFIQTNIHKYLQDMNTHDILDESTVSFN